PVLHYIVELIVLISILFFFFQAEDGIRDFHVTGVQTCALPIFTAVCSAPGPPRTPPPPHGRTPAGRRNSWSGQWWRRSPGTGTGPKAGWRPPPDRYAAASSGLPATSASPPGWHGTRR